MNRPVIALVLALGPLPAWSQTPEADRARCFSTKAEAKIGGCSALIDAKQTTGAPLAEVYNNRGVAYYAQHQTDQAIDDFTQAITLQPGYANAYFNRGQAYDRAGLPNRAIADFASAIQLRPDYADAMLRQGWVYWKTSQYDSAIAAFTKAIALRPASPEAYNARAGSYHDKGMREQAVADYRSALAIDPKNADALDGLATERALGPGGAQAVVASLPGSVWTPYGDTCEIRQIDFSGAATAHIQLPWQSDVTPWTFAGDRIQFTFREWDAKLTGTVVSNNEIDLEFEWKTTDNAPHFNKCRFGRKQ